MKNLKKLLSLALIGLTVFLFTTCQKEEQIYFETDEEIDAFTLKSADLDVELPILIERIEGMVQDDFLNQGNGNALKVKLYAVIKSLDRENINAASGQLYAYISQILEFVIQGKLNAVQANELLSCGYLDARDGFVYSVVLIGSQVWMAENLAYEAGAGCWAYENDENLAATFGRLYNWSAASKACPEGWHLPSVADWTILTDYLIINGYGFEGSGDEIAKSMAAESHWAPSPVIGTPGNDPGSNNSSNFGALPGGFFRSSDESFRALHSSGRWWSSTEFDATDAYRFGINRNFSTVNWTTFGKENGYTVRCVMD